MARTRALIVGISNYSASGRDNLPFCKNDIYAVNDALIKGLNMRQADIILCGETGRVTCEDFISGLQHLISISDDDDTIIVYFSGHGTTEKNEHYLIFSDTLVKTQQIIEVLEGIKAKSKILLLDCCFAGNFEVGGSAVFDISETADQFVGKGYAVVASCDAKQYSAGHPLKPISLFTSFLCEALTLPFITREGKKTLYDIWKLLFMLLENWNKHHPEDAQNPIYRANIGGTIYFDVEDYHPYVVREFFADCDSYIIYSVKPLHNGIAKRYCVQVILKQPMSYSEIAAINHEIVQKVKWLNIYGNKRQELRWKDRSANLVFCHFGLDETDMINSNYICHTTWVDDTQDKNWWYRLSGNSEVIDDIHFDFHPYYESLKIFTTEHTGTREHLIAKTRAIITRMVTLAEQLISLYNEYINGTKCEDDFRKDIATIIPELNKLYNADTDLDIAPDDLKEWSQLCSNLAGTIHDLTLYYGQNKFAERTPENRKACMDLSIKQYYKDLDRLKSNDILE